jgi:hypothetical protein
MAKKEEQKANTNGHDSGQIKVRVIEFELNGRNATLAEGIKAMTAAITSRAVVVQEPARPALPAIPKAGTTTTTTVEAEEIEQPEEGAELPGAEDQGEESSNGSESGSGPKRPYSYKTPKYMDELDFSKATISLEDFAKEKGNPTDVMDKYLLTVVWFKKHMSIEEVTVAHIYTAFDNVGWKSDMPANPSVPLRDLKSKRHVLTREQGAEGYKVNFKGEQIVEKMGK